MIYENQDEVGAALKKVIPSVVKREELFITSKLWNSAHQPAYAEKELDETLSQIGTNYLDLYRMYWIARSESSGANINSCSYSLAHRFPSWQWS